MAIWLLKTEPAECSLDDIRAATGGVMRWDGIRNYQYLDRLAALMLCMTAAVALPALLHACRGADARGRHFHALFHFQFAAAIYIGRLQGQCLRQRPGLRDSGIDLI